MPLAASHPTAYEVGLIQPGGVGPRLGSTGKTVFIAGDNCAVVDDIALTDSVIEDGSVTVLDAHNVTL